MQNEYGKALSSSNQPHWPGLPPTPGRPALYDATQDEHDDRCEHKSQAPGLVTADAGFEVVDVKHAPTMPASAS